MIQLLKRQLWLRCGFLKIAHNFIIDDYFEKIKPSRLIIIDCVLYFRCDKEKYANGCDT